MKKLFLSLAFAFLTVVSFYVVYLEFYGEKVQLPSSSQLSFTSLYGDYDIFIDGKKIGSVGDRQSGVFDVPSGKRSVKIVRTSPPQGFYFNMEKTILLEPNTRVEIQWESGPTLESSRGLVKYFVYANKINNGLLVRINPIWPGGRVYLNSVPLSEGKFLVETASVLNFKIDDAEGIFEPMEFQLNFTQDSIPGNLELHIDVYLYKKPFSLY